MRKLIIIAIVVLGAAAALVLSGAIPLGQSRERLLRRLNENGTVVRRSCGLGEAHVDSARWNGMNAKAQQAAASAIASWCAEQGGDATLTVLDYQTRAPLARWNGTALEPQP